MRKIVMILALTISVCFSSHLYTDAVMVTKGADIVQSVNASVGKSTAYMISEVTYQESMRYGLDFHFVLGVMATESRFNVNAKSYCGAIGLMQLMPKTAESVATKRGIRYGDLYDIETNVRVGVAYLDWLMKRFGRYELVAAGYNGGVVGARRYRDYKVGKISKTGVHPQTLDYVPKVMRRTDDFRRQPKRDFGFLRWMD